MDFREIDFSNLLNITRELVEPLIKNRITPNKIVYIEKGGVIPAYLIQHLIGGELISVSAERPKSQIKIVFSKILPRIPKRIRQILRRMELAFNKKISPRNVEINLNIKFSPDDIILIVDDSLDSGSTLISVIEMIISKGGNLDNIKILVINTTLNNSSIKPDFVFEENVIYGFPWSKDSKEYPRFIRIFEKYQNHELTPSSLWKELSIQKLV